MSANYVFGDQRFVPSVWGALRFEIFSFVGRLLSPRLRQPAQPLLQVGSGLNADDRYENLDFYVGKFWKAKHVGHDLRFPLPYPEGSFEGAFSEHTLEHLPMYNAIRLLSEVRRVLKPGAVFRVVVPDLGKFVACYNGTTPSPEFGQFANGCEAIWSVTQNWAHLSCWDSTMLQKQLLAAGFSAVREVAFRQGSDDRLLTDQQFREWESLYVEAVA